MNDLSIEFQKITKLKINFNFLCNELLIIHERFIPFYLGGCSFWKKTLRVKIQWRWRYQEYWKFESYLGILMASATHQQFIYANCVGREEQYDRRICYRYIKFCRLRGFFINPMISHSFFHWHIRVKVSQNVSK